MIYWAPVLHFYQPPTQISSVLDRICDECYRPLTKVFLNAPNARATFNFQGALTELLNDHGAHDVIAGIRKLGDAGKIEFTGTGMYHPILPLIPECQQRRQISLNHGVNRRAFGKCFKPVGFFPPELAVADCIVPAIAESGHRWLLAPGVANNGDWPLDFIPRANDEYHDVAIVMRDDILSNKISFREIDAPGFISKLREMRGLRQNMYVITAMDAETFGHHHRGWEDVFLGEVFRLLREQDAAIVDGPDQIRAVTVTDLLSLFPSGPRVPVKPSSWSTSGDDLQAGNPYPLWKDPGNRIHQLQWEVARIAMNLVDRAEAIADNDCSRHYAGDARALLDRALHSCQFWWASGRPMWEINMIHRGLFEQQEALLNATRAIRSSGISETDRRDVLYQFIAARELVDRVVEMLVE